MEIRRIVVPLTGAESDDAALAMGFAVAHAHGAHLDGIYLRPDPAETVPYVGDAASAAMIEDIYQATKTASDAASRKARQALEAAAAAANVPLVELMSTPVPRPTGRFLEEVGAISRAIVRKAKLADLVVTAGLGNNPPALAAFEAALIAARRPVLVASQKDPARLPSQIVIAWNGSTEAAYAVARAMPLLKAAQSVTVLSGELDLLDVPSPAALVAYLSLHEIKAASATLDLSGKAVGPALLERVASLGADLIVMGGYGHSRLREFILGGVTRYVIGNATTSVLLAH